MLGLRRCCFVTRQSCGGLVPRTLTSASKIPADGKTLSHFINTQSTPIDEPAQTEPTVHPVDGGMYGTSNFAVTHANSAAHEPPSFFIETYGCQMNVSDSEIVHALLNKSGFVKSQSCEEADVVLVNTCSIRDKAEERVWGRLRELRAARSRNKQQKVAVLGCMAERLKEKLLESDRLADVVVGPDAYRDLPRLLHNALHFDERGINVMLSVEETYADISPIREDESGVSAFISIMRGCNNMCSYCIVPFTRGRERSRDLYTIVEEARSLADRGVKEITLLGQNVNSYNFFNGPKPNVSFDLKSDKVEMSKGFRSIVKIPFGGIRFATLLEEVAKAAPESRIRFTSPHPKDFPDDVLRVIKEYPNVCKMIHIPAQSGSTAVLERMRRGYSRESYIELINHIRRVVPGISLSSDFITGFCGETEEEHQDTLSLMEYVKYDHAYMFAYSQREKTHAHRKYEDDVDPAVKSRRLQEVVGTYIRNAKLKAEDQVGQVQLVLVDGVSRRNENELRGRNDANKPVVLIGESSRALEIQKGDYVVARIESASQTSFRATALIKTTLQDFYRQGKQQGPQPSHVNAHF